MHWVVLRRFFQFNFNLAAECIDMLLPAKLPWAITDMRAKAMKSLQSALTGVGIVAPLAIVIVSSSAAASEPRKATERLLLNEPGEITTVVDAFDDGDPFDLNITLGYQHTWKFGKVLRETYLDQGKLSSGGYMADTMNVAKHTGSTSRLNTRVDIGLYKDLALYLRMPIILSDSNKLESLDGSGDNQGFILQGIGNEQLFSLPFESPKRSGIEYLAVGLDVNIMNQTRDSSKPTWLFGIEGRFNISEPMHACGTESGLNQPGDQVRCAHPSDVNRNGVAEDYSHTDTSGQVHQLEGNKSGSRKAGVSRGTTGLEVHTYVSRRIKYIEPYGGLRALFEFPVSSSDFGHTNVKGSPVNNLPMEGWVTLGVQFIPWENREKFHRLTFDLRGEAAYRSEGRDYSPLFDALGGSDALSMRRPNYAKYRENLNRDTQYMSRSVVDTSSQRVYVTGLADVQAHGKMRGMGGVTWQAGEFVKFQLGLSYTFEQGHMLTMDQPCNAAYKGDVTQSGPCRTLRVTTDGGQTNYHFTATGIPNPNYRPAVNMVGRRFKYDDAGTVDLWFNGIVMF